MLYFASYINLFNFSSILTFRELLEVQATMCADAAVAAVTATSAAATSTTATTTTTTRTTTTVGQLVPPADGKETVVKAGKS